MVSEHRACGEPVLQTNSLPKLAQPASKESLKEEDVLIDASKIKSLQTASLNMEGSVERS